MTQRVLGPKGGRRRKRLLMLPLLVAAALALFFITSAQAVHDENVFELEGNAITDNSPSEPQNPQSTACSGAQCDDWDHVFAGTSNAVADGFVTDETGAGDSILQGGSTKDINDIPAWAWKQTTTTSVQDKDDIEHAYVAQYVVDKSGTDQHCGSSGPTANCVLLYFGADRFSNSGDAVMGFWLFRSKISKSALDAQGNGTFTGSHTAKTATDRGDILIVSDFRAGGKAPSIQVYEWVTSGGSASDHLDQIGGSANPASCTQAPPEKNNQPPVPPVAANDNFCGTANQQVVHSPWPYTPKANSGGTAGQGTLNGDANTQFGIAEFMEGGINMTALGLGNECFNSFLAETRSSHAPTSTLSDFTLGNFGSCGATFATQTSKTTLQIGDAAPTDAASINVSSSGGNPPKPTGVVSFYLCGPSTTQITSCDPTGKTAFDTENLSGATQNGNVFTVTSTAPSITSAGYYCFAARWPGDTNYTAGPYGDDGTNECFQVTPKTPSIVTAVSNAGPVVPGTAVSDTATLSGTATPSNGTQGKITFTAYGPDDANCATAVYTSVVNPISGNGSYNSFSDGNGGAFAPTSPGVYRWRASYEPATGDVNNVAASTACGDTNESFTVQQFQPQMTTAQTWSVKDSATVTVSGGGNLSGTVHFELHKTSDCSDAAVDTQNVPVSGASPQTVSTTVNASTTFTTSQPTLYWKVSYTSANSAQKNIAATCTENSSVTINN